MSDRRIYFWQTIVTPHMAYLADGLAAKGFDVVYIANKPMSTARVQTGWSLPKLEKAKIYIATDSESINRIVLEAQVDSIHLCQGIRSNGLIGHAQKSLANRGIQYWVVMETIDDKRASGVLKRFLYRWLLRHNERQYQGILAIGSKTAGWLVTRGASQEKTFPFAYFLSHSIRPVSRQMKKDGPFRFLFVGQLIERKRVDFLLQALAKLSSYDFELMIIGDGPMRCQWESLATFLLSDKVHWLGLRPMADIPQMMANADCLVLPSRHDGWGAVISESLMVGTPVICSDACGAAGAVSASGYGGVFQKDNIDELTYMLGNVLHDGVLGESDRFRLKEWARSLGVEAGSDYFLEILRFLEHRGERPVAPWLRK
jgi:glycosyltransferase involved in cell wall biosynthesis